MSCNNCDRFCVIAVFRDIPYLPRLRRTIILLLRLQYFTSYERGKRSSNDRIPNVGSVLARNVQNVSKEEQKEKHDDATSY